MMTSLSKHPTSIRANARYGPAAPQTIILPVRSSALDPGDRLEEPQVGQ
jgi:hypothetical protein